MRHTEKRPNSNLYRDLERADRRMLEEANQIATDRTITKAGKFLRSRVRAVGLKGLANVVGYTSSLKKGRKAGTNAYGVIFARGGDQSRSGQALLSYARGATITPKRGKWLWFQTEQIARQAKISGIGRERLTPELYRQKGSPLGPLKFQLFRNGTARFYADGLVTTPKGRARLPGKRNKQPTKRITIFLGIKVTRRGKRFDEREILSKFAGLLPAELSDELARRRR